jgi:hypothetical protein
MNLAERNMQNIPYESPYTIVGTLHRRTFDTLEEVCLYLGANRIESIGDSPHTLFYKLNYDIWPHRILPTSPYYRLAVIDGNGSILPPYKVKETYWNIPVEKRAMFWSELRYKLIFPRKRSFTFRRGPVPNLNHGRGKPTWLKFPKTYQENRYHFHLRHTIFELEDAGYNGSQLRAKLARRYKMPTAWDDRTKTCLRDKNWKRYRITQYVGNGVRKIKQPTEN